MSCIDHIDSTTSIGIRYTHNEFRGRARYPGYDPVDNSTGSNQQGLDCDGHGTHVAALAGGITYGAAKNSLLYSVRVLDCNGSAPVSIVLDGIVYATLQIIFSGRPGIINLSLGSSRSFSQVQNDVVRAVALENFVHVVWAAGNDNINACVGDPEDVIIVGATDIFDSRAWFSNFGSCVDIFAPGDDITSASLDCDDCTVVFSGTSMATPITTGVVATILEANSTMTPVEVAQYLNDTATQDVLTDVGPGSPNSLLYAQGTRRDRTEGNTYNTIRLVHFKSFLGHC